MLIKGPQDAISAELFSVLIIEMPTKLHFFDDNDFFRRPVAPFTDMV